MAISFPRKSFCPPFKSIHFNIPHVESWDQCTNLVDSNGVHLEEWYEIKKERIHLISIEAKRIFRLNFTDFCEKITYQMELRYNGKYEFGKPWVHNRYLIRWIKKTNAGITFLFTLLTAHPPDFFILEYETTNVSEYNSNSSVYLKMLQEAKISEYALFHTLINKNTFP